MNADTANLAAEVLAEQDYDVDVRSDYSGRGTYGKSTAAIVTNAPEVVVGIALGMVLQEHAFDLPDVRTDNLGRSIVVY